ncbi:MAG: hypothetical protein AB1521_13185 [Bacteroidota bacterium]
MKINYLVLFLFISSFFSFSHGQNNINSDFYRTWLIYEYYKDIESGKTPYELYGKMKPIMQLYFFEGHNKVLMGSFAEGLQKDFVIKNFDTIIVNDDEIKFTIFLLKDNGEIKLMVDNGRVGIVFKGLDKKYYDRQGVDWFINDRFITGNYIAATDSSQLITFSYDGSVAGIKNFNKYRIPLFQTGIPADFNTIFLQEEPINGGAGILLHWGNYDGRLILYDLTDEEGPDDKIKSKYLELIKIN